MILAPAQSLSFLCLLSAITVYAFLGLPTPNRPGWGEVMIGFMLVVAVGLPRVAQIIAG